MVSVVENKININDENIEMKELYNRICINNPDLLEKNGDVYSLNTDIVLYGNAGITGNYSLLTNGYSISSKYISLDSTKLNEIHNDIKSVHTLVKSLALINEDKLVSVCDNFSSADGAVSLTITPIKKH